ncbi:cyclopropane fatty acyl phospholipid synthase [Thiococcus pfennigii]|uniref:cyclopropane fatty acyl phospholipid synthase n=1 Tax=Thiococcus pfennigii TaxID=1057 RepID=UPI001F5C04DC|nr:cyclopropane fatty acyl phospholipid synthase [Thiococcus pfennigii]
MATTQIQTDFATTRGADSPRAMGRRPPQILADLIAPTGVRFNGDQPWDIRIHDDSVYARALRHGTLGFGEAYMDGAWDSERLDETITRLLSHDLDTRIHGVAKLRFALGWLREVLVNRQSKARAFQVGEHHYDIGNDVYRAMLDSTMSYSCGYWEQAVDLEQAQQAKLALIARKLELVPGQRVLDIGCGWGGLSQYLAAHQGVEVVGITISRDQQRLAEARCAGLPVEIRLMDYRDLPQRDGTGFDRIVSVGMFEHVGPKNYPAYFATAARLLRDEGLFLLHTIGAYRTMPTPDPWIDRYIFPNGRVPAAQQIARAIEPHFLLEDWHNFGQDYDRTLMAWWHNFDAAWPQLRSARYDERFYRMWKYYLLSCAGMFRAR